MHASRSVVLLLTRAAALCACLPVCYSMAASAASTRHSPRTRQQPLTLAEEQAASVLSRMEQRDVAAALRSSLASSWDSEDEDDEPVAEPDEEEDEAQKEEKEAAPAVHAEQGGWSMELHDIVIPLPRLRHLQNRPPPADATAFQLLQHFLPQQLMNEFAQHTNSTAPQDWRSTTAAELYAFLGVHIYMGIDRLPRTEMYWSETFGHPFITALFSRDRFKELLRYFRVVPAPVAAAPRNPLPHVRALAEKLNASFAAHFTPTQHLSLDEAMVAYKGRATNKQYIPSKPHKWGYKIYCLASENYLLHFEVYEGKEEDPSMEGATYDTVMRMVQQYQDQQLVLFTDNWFTSPTLLNALAQRGIRLCGSVRRNRKGMPSVPKATIDGLRRGEYIQRQKGDTSFVAWKDQKTVCVLYNHVSPRALASLDRWSNDGEKVSIACPQAIHDYFYHARSVDVINQLHYSYLIGRKARRCWPRLAWWLLDMCILNAFKLWAMGQQHASQLRFREELMHELIKQLPAEYKPHRASAHPHPTAALAKDHFPAHTDVRGHCVVCNDRAENRVRSRVICAKCGVHLCIGDCFAIYHADM